MFDILYPKNISAPKNKKCQNVAEKNQKIQKNQQNFQNPLHKTKLKPQNHGFSHKTKLKPENQPKICKTKALFRKPNL